MDLWAPFQKKSLIFNFTRISNTQTIKREMYVKSLKTVFFSKNQMCKFKKILSIDSREAEFSDSA